MLSLASYYRDVYGQTKDDDTAKIICQTFFIRDSQVTVR